MTWNALDSYVFSGIANGAVPAPTSFASPSTGQPWIDVVGTIYTVASGLLRSTADSGTYSHDCLLAGSSTDEVNQRVVAGLPYSSSVPAIALRYQRTGNIGNAYLALANLSSGKMQAFVMQGASNAPTQIGATQSFTANSAHSYTLDASVVGVNPTTFSITLTDVTANAVLATLSVTDSTANLQQIGAMALDNAGSSGSVTNFTTLNSYSYSTGPALTISPTNGSVADASTTQSLTATLTGSSASLTAAVTGGGALSTTAPTSGTPFTYTPPTTGSGTATITVADSTDNLTATSTISYAPVGAPALTLAPATSTVNGATGTVSLTATLNNSNATLGASVTGGGTLSNASPTSGVPFTFTAPATGNGTATITVTDTTDSLTKTATIAYNSGLSVVCSPTSFPLGVATPFTLAGTGTSWTSGTKPTVSGGTNASVSNMVLSGQTITGTLWPGTVAGTLTVGDTSDNAIASVAAVSNPAINAVWDGTSLTYGQNGSNPGTTSATRVARVLSGLGPSAAGVNLGVSGQKLSTMISRFAGTVVPKFKSGQINYLIVEGGHNDFGADQKTAAQVIALIQQYIAQAIALGPTTLRIIWATEGPAAYPGVYPALFDSMRDQVNTFMRTNWQSMGIFALSDMAANQLIGYDGAEYNSTYYSSTDYTHPTDAGYTIWGDTDLAAIQNRLATNLAGAQIERSYSFY